ncbi:MAG TPA: dihydroxy-acid dehydratase [Candidatus Saccharimonadales bacterium]
MRSCGMVCSEGEPIDFDTDFIRITDEVAEDLDLVRSQWTQVSIDSLRRPGSGMLDGPLAEAMMQVTPCNPQLPQVGLAVNYIEGSSCHTHTRDGIGQRAGFYLGALGLSPNTFYVSGVNDGVTNGYPEMSASLRSRDAIAFEVENTAYGAGVEGVVAIPACDKGFPGMMMAAVILNRPFVVVPGGSAPTGRDPQDKDNRLGILDVFTAKAQEQLGQISGARLQEICGAAINPGNCNGVFTADTMASINEVIGLGVVGSGNNIANTAETDRVMIDSIDALMHAMQNQLLPRDIVTKESLDNAVTVLATIGGSTNAVLHLLALAKVAEVPYGYKEMDVIFNRTPFRLKMQPNAPDGYWQEYVDLGGVKGTIRQLLDEDRLDPDTRTMNKGKTLGEAYSDVDPIEPYNPKGQNHFFFPEDNPILERAHITILHGNLAENGCVMKVNDPEKLNFDGKAVVFESEPDALVAIAAKDAFSVFDGKAVIVRNLGPKAAGMPELLKIDKALQNLRNANAGDEQARTLLISDARQSGGAGHPNVTHVSPEAYVGGTIALVRDGDRIVVNALEQTINLDVTEEVLAQRRSLWIRPKPVSRVGAAAMFAAYALGAEEGGTILAPPQLALAR